MANRPALQALSHFISQPTPQNGSCLVNIPSVYNVLCFHESRREPYPEYLLGVCHWVYKRGQGALDGLIVYKAPVVEPNATEASGRWQEVSARLLYPLINLMSITNRPGASIPNHSFDIDPSTHTWLTTYLVNRVGGEGPSARSSIQSMGRNA
jgi:hypothetical protein